MTDDLIHRMRTLMAEIEARLSAEATLGTSHIHSGDDLSPKLNQALSSMAERRRTMPFDIPRHSRANMPSTADVPLESHEDIRAKARAYKPTDYSRNMAEERERNYVHSPDPDFDNSWALGTGDLNEP